MAPRPTAGCSGVLSRTPPSMYQPPAASGVLISTGGNATGIADDAIT